MNEWSSWSSAVLLRNARNQSRTTVSAVSGIGASLASYGPFISATKVASFVLL
jgi:hypothetical protein